MAIRLTGPNAGNFPRKNASEYGRWRYPWNEWTDGERWRIAAFDDFVCSPTGMRRNLEGRAYTMGIRVEVHRCSPLEYEFRFIKREQ